MRKLKMNLTSWHLHKIRLLERIRRIKTFLLTLGYTRPQTGAFTYGRPTIYSWGGFEVSIGKFCSLSKGIVIVGGEHNLHWVSTFPLRERFRLPGRGQDGHPTYKGPVTIGHDVWIGMGAFILSGVTIGDGSVVAARSVVTRDVPPYAIVAGNPAQVVRYRFEPDTIAALLRIKWWEWDLSRTVGNVNWLNGSGVEDFVKRFDPGPSE